MVSAGSFSRFGVVFRDERWHACAGKPMREVLEAALRADEAGEPAALVTVVSTEGSTPRKAGAKMVVFADGRAVGTIGGGCVEAEVVRRAHRAIEERKVTTTAFDLTPDMDGGDGLACGGRMHLLIEPIEGRPTLCLFGAGHVAQPLARMARACGFRVEVADDRALFASRERFPDADRILVADFATASESMSLGRNAYAIVVTRGHKGDMAALLSVLGRGLRFVGLLGSKPKMLHVLASLEEAGASPRDVAQIHCPVGLDIGAETPEEIAVSILAEMITVRRRKAERRAADVVARAEVAR
jgi:xanthine dehydrogenase accessory factor